MMPATFAVAVIAAVLASTVDAQISTGYATYSNNAGGVCTGGASALPAVAMNAGQFANGAACGQCIQITGSGNGAGTSPVSTAPYVATINNVCPQCAFGDIDLQESGNGKYGISWSFVACPGGGRKLIETPFLGDTTVYTGFAHVGTVAVEAEGASAPQHATLDNAESIAEQKTVETADEGAEAITEIAQEATLESEAEPIANNVSSGENNVASQGHLETAEEQQEVVQTSRRLLKSM